MSATLTLNPVPRDREDVRAVWPVLLPLVVSACGLLALLSPGLSSWTSWDRVLVLLVLCATASVLEWYAVELPDGEQIHLSPIVVLYAAVVYGVVPAVLAALVATLATQIGLRKAPAKVIYNVAHSVVGAGFAGWCALFAVQASLPLPLIVVAALLGLSSVNVVFVTLARARTTASSWRAEVRQAVLSSWTTYLMVAFVLPFLIVAIRASPGYGALAIGPLLTIRAQLMTKTRASRARQEALTDVLTGLGNRRLFDERLANEVARADRREIPLTVCLIDVDGFKAINDRFGHLAGDRALIAVASTLRRGGEAFRYGGDEFALVLPEHDEAEAAAIADAVRARVRLLAVEGVTLSISHGLAVYRSLGPVPASEIVRVADDNLYRAKRASRRTL